MKPHRKIFEEHYGIKLNSKEHIHHIDLDKENNDIDNLLKVNPSQHAKIHTTLHSALYNLVDLLIKKRIIYYDQYQEKYKSSKTKLRKFMESSEFDP